MTKAINKRALRVNSPVPRLRLISDMDLDLTSDSVGCISHVALTKYGSRGLGDEGNEEMKQQDGGAVLVQGEQNRSGQRVFCECKLETRPSIKASK